MFKKVTTRITLMFSSPEKCPPITNSSLQTLVNSKANNTSKGSSEVDVLVFKGKCRKIKRSELSSLFLHRPISPLIYWHFRKLYKSRRTPSTRALLMISSSEQLMDLLLALINMKLFKNFDSWPLDEPECYFILFYAFALHPALSLRLYVCVHQLFLQSIV